MKGMRQRLVIKNIWELGTHPGWWLTSVILAIWEAEIWRIMV
jgi:hypothetical protein